MTRQDAEKLNAEWLRKLGKGKHCPHEILKLERPAEGYGTVHFCMTCGAELKISPIEH